MNNIYHHNDQIKVMHYKNLATKKILKILSNKMASI